MIEYLFSPYESYSWTDILLEVLGVAFGLLSVIFSKKNNVLVYPTGMISTAIFVCLLFKFGLLGDMMINAYYFIISIYGWYIWTLKVDPIHVTPITYTTKKEHKISVLIFLASIVFVTIVYHVFDKWTSWTAYVDTITTAIFFVGMWLMAKRKVENWLYWIVGDLISVPLYFYKGLTLTAIQYLIFTIIAYFGYRAWIRYQNNSVIKA
ncbi:nicotinamide riboside transporter PnuC [Gangjinia marincola]|uniref:Nicotinamide riboside transporter PnuC n=1 Tax=Gangjinia marincola TaxID=578463 RepID=A0ABN1MHC7_9FLAO